MNCCYKCGKELNTGDSTNNGLCTSCFYGKSVATSKIVPHLYNYKCTCGGEFNVPAVEYGAGTYNVNKCPFCGLVMQGL